MSVNFNDATRQLEEVECVHINQTAFYACKDDFLNQKHGKDQKCKKKETKAQSMIRKLEDNERMKKIWNSLRNTSYKNLLKIGAPFMPKNVVKFRGLASKIHVQRDITRGNKVLRFARKVILLHNRGV